MESKKISNRRSSVSNCNIYFQCFKCFRSNVIAFRISAVRMPPLLSTHSDCLFFFQILKRKSSIAIVNGSPAAATRLRRISFSEKRSVK